MTTRRNIMLGTAGHVDHGKTALVKLLTGCNTDTLMEEQRRGLTIELGYAPCRMWDERIVGVVDVPGHVDFIRNMVAGAHGIDVVILVVAANDGVMPQTREHLDILTLMGVRHGLIALTKIDLVDAEMRGLVEEETRRFVTGTFLEGADICPMSNMTGEGFEGFYHALNRAVEACEPRRSGGLFRMWVSSVFTVRGFGTIVTGIPSSGAVRAGDRVLRLPGGEAGRVRGLEVYGEETTEGRAGECVACNISDLPPDGAARGDALCGSDAFQPVTMIEAELRLLPRVEAPLKDYLEVHLHVGTAETMAHVAVLDDSRLYPGRAHFVQLRLEKALPAAPGDRFVVRANLAGRLTTIGGGQVLGTSNTRLRRNRSWTLENLARRRDALDEPAQWCALMLHEAGGPLTPAALAKRALMTVEQISELLPQLCADGIALETAGHDFVHHDVIDRAEARIVEALEAWYAENPLALGLEEAALLPRLELPRPVAELALNRLIARRSVERQGAVLALQGRAVRLSPEEEALRQRLEALFRQAGLCPPEPGSLPVALNVTAARANSLLTLLMNQGALIRVSPELIMHRDAVDGAQKTVIRLFAAGRQFTTMEFRDALGVSRKYAVPLLDYFDGQRLTVRMGNVRTLGARLKKG
ncbi:MAG: selenocysteine-specific translation elongation factor [Armatimonadota bacterium]